MTRGSFQRAGLFRVAMAAALAMGGCGRRDAGFQGTMDRLRTGSAAERARAAASLVEFGEDPAAVVTALSGALNDPDAGVRKAAVGSLAFHGVGAAPAEPNLIARLERDESPEIRRLSAELLGIIKGSASAAALTAALDDSDPGVRIAVIRALGRFDESVLATAESRLVADLGADRPAELREAVVDALGPASRDRESIARVLAGVAADDESASVRRRAAMHLKSRFGFEIPTLAAALDDADPGVRLEAFGRLCWHGTSDSRVAPALAGAFEKADDGARAAYGGQLVAMVLDWPDDAEPEDAASRRHAEAAAAMRRILEITGAAGRMEAGAVLTRMVCDHERLGSARRLAQASAARDALVARVADANEDERLRLDLIAGWGRVQAAIQTRLGRVGEKGEEAGDSLRGAATWAETMVRLLDDPAPAIRDRAVRELADGLAPSRVDPSFAAAWEGLVPRLATAAESSDPIARSGATRILGLLGPEAIAAAAPLKRLATATESPAEKSAIDEALARIGAGDALGAAEPAARIAAIGRLGEIGWRARKAMPALAGLLADPDPVVRRVAAETLARLAPAGGVEPAPLLSAMAVDPDPSARVAMLRAVVVLPGADAGARVAALTKGLRDSDPDNRATAAGLATATDGPDVVAALEEGLKAEAEAVVAASARTLAGGLLDDATIAPALVEALLDPKRREAAAAAIDERVADRAAARRATKDAKRLGEVLAAAMPPLLAAAADPLPEVRFPAFQALDAIAALARPGGDEIALLVAPAFEAMIDAIDDDSADVRSIVMHRLGRAPTRRVEAVAALLGRVGRSAEDGDEATDGLIALAMQAADDPTLASALAPAVPVLIRRLDATDAAARAEAARALGTLGTIARDAEAPLRTRFETDPDANARRVAGLAVAAVVGKSPMPPPPTASGLPGMLR